MIGYKQYWFVSLVRGVYTNFLLSSLQPIFLFYHKIFNALFVLDYCINANIFDHLFHGFGFGYFFLEDLVDFANFQD